MKIKSYQNPEIFSIKSYKKTSQSIHKFSAKTIAFSEIFHVRPPVGHLENCIDGNYVTILYKGNCARTTLISSQDKTNEACLR